MFEVVESVQKFGKERIDAIAASASTWGKGVHQIAKETADYSKKSLEASQNAAEKLASAKSLENVIEVQTEFAKSSYADFIGQATKISALYRTLAKETFEAIVASNSIKSAEAPTAQGNSAAE
jgi:hypothetical protein